MTGNIIEKKILIFVVHCSDTNDNKNIGSLEIHKMMIYWMNIPKIIAKYEYKMAVQNIVVHARGFNEIV